MSTSTKTNTAKFPRAGWAAPAVLVATAVAVSLLLHGPISRKVGSILGNAQATAIEQSGTACARFNWDVRLAASITRVNDSELVLNMRDGTTVVYSFDSAAHTVTRSKDGETATILSKVASVSFSAYEAPTTYGQMQPTTAANARVVGLKWTSLGAVDGISHPQSATASLQMASR